MSVPSDDRPRFLAVVTEPRENLPEDAGAGAGYSPRTPSDAEQRP